MVVELAAVRLLAPWFGASQSVWTNVIGVILLALALGYLIGARLSERREPLVALGVALLCAGALTAVLPIAVRPVARIFLPDQLALDAAISLVVWGSLAASMLLFLVPAVLLGMVAPLAVESVQRVRGAGAGDAGGRVLAFSTLGSLAGVFGTTHWLVPTLGLSGTFLAASATLCAAGAAGTLLARRGRAAALLIAAPLIAPALGERTTPAAPEGWRELASVESPYQSVRVMEDATGPSPMRHLQVNEAFDSFQSVWQPEVGLLPEGYYYNLFALPLYWSAPLARARVFVLGLGAGTTWRVLEGAHPAGIELDLSGVELDPEVVRLARDHMELPDDGPGHRVLAGFDARVALRARTTPADLVVLDCYANQVEIPAHLATVEFLEEVRAALSPGGWLATNVGGFGFEDPLVRAIAATTAEAFGGQALVVRVPAARNYIVFARNEAELPFRDGLLRLPSDVPSGVFDGLALPGAAEVVTPAGGRVLHDDDAPLEVLQEASFERARSSLGEVGP